MKFTLAAIIASASLTAPVFAGQDPPGMLPEGSACYVTWDKGNGSQDAHYSPYDPHGDGSTVCIGGYQNNKGLACNFQLQESEEEPDPADLIAGTCEQQSCMGGNSRKPPETSSHRITICHRTCSVTNPWVRITIDDDAWAGTEECGHGVQHDVEEDCNGRSDWTPWGPIHHDYIIRDHGTRGAGSREYVNYINGWADNGEEEKAYWKVWERACPYVRNGACCDIAQQECCGYGPPTTTTTTTTTPGTTTTTTTTPTTTTPPPAATTTTPATTTTTTSSTPNRDGGGGGDPHFARWGQEHDSFHGECDLVMVHSEQFHNGAGFDLHARTKIQDYFSYMETAALRVGDSVLEFYNDHFYMDGFKFTPEDLPLTFGDEYKYTIKNGRVEAGKNLKFYQYYQVDLHEDSSMMFKFYKQYLTIDISGNANDFSDATGLLGEYHTGAMITREGGIMSDFKEFGFEWQVRPEDNFIFREARAPQLPYEMCRMPTAARPSRRLRNSEMVGEAQEACAHVKGGSFQLCVDDVVTVGDSGIATLW
uniref:VWFD domain-containing protein n=1 Tax=Amphora coffeiformis TaxID=265554 RepID=A0A6S8IS67_9STRA